MREQRIFIGSTTEELDLAEEAESILESDFDVTIWNDDVWESSVFKINNSFLSDLLKASLKFDYGILIGTCDDIVTYRGEEVLQPRDNVLFELGLFVGRLGISKCAFIIEEELKVLSDLQGISLARFTKKDPDSFGEAVNKVKDFFSTSKTPDINFFPSSTLAAVYFENLLKPTCEYLIKNSGFQYEQKKYESYEINVVLPNRINTNVNLQFEKLKSKIDTETVSFEHEGRPRSINLDSQIEDGKLKFVDFPTIITGINYSLANLLPQEFNQLNQDYDLVLARELKRFEVTLKQLLLRDGFEDMVKIVGEEDL